MSGFSNGPTNRGMQDYNTQFTCVGANGTTANQGALFDLGQTAAFPVNEHFDLEIMIPAMPNNVGTATGNGVLITVVNNATSNAANSTNISGGPAVFVQGVASTGSAASNVFVKLPGSTLEWIGLQAVAANAANVGDNSAAVITAKLLY
jgi:hypothetical protein